MRQWCRRRDSPNCFVQMQQEGASSCQLESAVTVSVGPLPEMVPPTRTVPDGAACFPGERSGSRCRDWQGRGARADLHQLPPVHERPNCWWEAGAHI